MTTDSYGSQSFAAFLYGDEEYYASRIKEFETKVDSGSANTHHLNNLAVLYSEIGEINKGLETFRRSYESDPSNAKAHLNRGKLLNKIDREDEAIEEFQKAVEINDGDYSINLNLAYTLTDRGQGADAIPYFLRAIKLGFSNDIVCNRLADAYEMAGDENNARRYRKRAERHARGRGGLRQGFTSLWRC